MLHAEACQAERTAKARLPGPAGREAGMEGGRGKPHRAPPEPRKHVRVWAMAGSGVMWAVGGSPGLLGTVELWGQ